MNFTFATSLQIKSMKKLLLITFISMRAYCSFAQLARADFFEINSGIKDKRTTIVKVTFFGTVTDATSGQALPGASVYLSDAKIGAIADPEGKFKLTNVPAGHYLIEVSFTGYNSIVEHIDLETDTEKNFSLHSSITENQGVTVTGVSSATSIRKTPVPVSIVRRIELLQTPSANIIDALARKPGISQVTTGAGISKPIIRGLGYNRVVVINDGVRQEGQQWGDEHGIEVDELSVNKAEILKGAASLMYGSDALAGVINLITNVPVAEGTTKGNLLAEYQTNNKLAGFNGNIASNKKGINWNLYGTYKNAGSYTNKYDGRVLNSGFNEKNFGGYIGVNKSWGYSHLLFSSFNQNVGLIEGERADATGKFILFAGTPLERTATNDDLTSTDLFVPKQKILHRKITSDNSFVINRSKLKVNIGLQNNIRNEFANPEDAAEKNLSFDLTTMNYNIQWQLPEMKDWRTTIGVNGIYQNNKNKGLEALIPNYNLFDIGGFVYTQRSVEKLTISGGGRFDNRHINSKQLLDGASVKFPAFARSFSNFSGSIGASYEANNFVTLKANVARGFRAPNMAELASNGTHEGTNRYEYGEQNLKSESSLQFDAGIELNYEHISFAFNAFTNNINNFVYYRKLESVSGGDSTLNINGTFIPTFRFDQNNAKLNGVEVVFDIHPHPLDWLHFENSFSFVRGKFDKNIDGTNNLPLIPAPHWLSDLKATFLKAGKSLRNVYVKLEVDKNFDQNKPFTAYKTETKTTGYVLLNAGIGGDITSKNKTIVSIHIGALNLTDVAYQSHLSRLKYTAENLVTGRRGVFNTGRNFSIKLNIPFSFK
jgi:iron complex outermembrane recepter protein